MDYKEAMEDARKTMEEWEANPVASYSRFMQAKTFAIAMACIAGVELLVIFIWVLGQ